MFHMAVATKYLVRTKYGTGTSTFRTMLQETLDHTAAAKVDEKGGDVKVAGEGDEGKKDQ
jgi:hypothetical protein